MKTNIKQTAALTLAAGAILLSGPAGRAATTTTVMSGTATLATVGTAPGVAGTATGPDAITVTYWVTLASGVYTYNYVVNNPVGNVILSAIGGPNAIGTTFVGNGNVGKQAYVNSLSVSFDTTASGSYNAGTQTAVPQTDGAIAQNNGVNGLFWSFALPPRGSSPTLSFQSSLPPAFGNASAMGPNPPGPWASATHGQAVPVPATAISPLILPGTTLVQGGIATLAPMVPPGGFYTSPLVSAALTVTYAVVEDPSSVIYTYEYILHNPAGDVQFGTGPAVVGVFQFTFNSQASGAFLQADGIGLSAGTGGAGAIFSSPITPGNSSPTLWFRSTLAPTAGFTWASPPSGDEDWGGSLPVPNVP